MTDQQHPITPPPELQEEWLGLWPQDALLQAARWGADQELEACCEWLLEMGLAADGDIEILRHHRRPKPKSPAKEALGDFEDIASLLMQNRLPCNTGRIRRALERLQELEGQG